MDDNEKLQLLLEKANIKLTGFSKIVVRQSDEKGVPIGLGECKAVILRLNEKDRDTGANQAATHFYYGNAQQQEYECLRGINSNIIFCESLEQVFVRLPQIGAFPSAAVIQIQIYN